VGVPELEATHLLAHPGRCFFQDGGFRASLIDNPLQGLTVFLDFPQQSSSELAKASPACCSCRFFKSSTAKWEADYLGRDLRTSHAGLQITPSEWEASLELTRKALRNGVGA
jgi:hypothetical protein